MAETKLGGNISLIGFDSLEPVEIIVIKKLVGNYVKKLSNQAAYESLKLQLKMHKKGKTFIHEISALASVNDKSLSASREEYNLYSCLNEVLNKIMAEVEHNKRTAKEIGEEAQRKEEQAKIKEKKEEIEE